MKASSHSLDPARCWRVVCLLAAGSLCVLGAGRAQIRSLELTRAENTIPAGILFTRYDNRLIFPHNAGTTVVSSTAIIAYDLTGKEVNRIVLEGPQGRAEATRPASFWRAASTADVRSFDKPQVYFVQEVGLAPSAQAYLHVIVGNGLASRRYPIVARDNSFVSADGSYYATSGDRLQGLPVLGSRVTPPAGQFNVYDRRGQQLSQLGSAGDPYFLYAIHDSGRIAAGHGEPGKPTSRVALLRVDGKNIWERPEQAAGLEVMTLSFTADGEYLIEELHSNDPDRPAQEVKVWDGAGKIAYQRGGKTRFADACGGSLVLLQERDERHFFLVDSSQGKTVMEFAAQNNVQDVRARISPDGKTLYLALYYLDASGQMLVRIEARDLTARVVAQRELGKATGPTAYLMFASYGDGLHWLVPGEDALYLLRP